MASDDSDREQQTRRRGRDDDDRDRRRKPRDASSRERDSPRDNRHSRRRSRSRSPRRRSRDDRHRHRHRDDRDPHRHSDSRNDDHSRREKNHTDERDSQDDRGNHLSKRADKEDTSRSLVKSRGPLPSQQDQFAVATGDEPEKPKEQPNFGTTGHLAAASNAVAQADGTTITLKYHEPAEARKPNPRDEWKLFVFKGSDIVDTVELGSRSCWLVGRELAVVDLPAEHPSVSKQHAVIQFRFVEKKNEFGDRVGKVKPYLLDLESANGTKLNGNKVPESRYLELRDGDLVRFGDSTRDYVFVLPPREAQK
jgi:smad nuclear-interacting protein 1